MKVYELLADPKKWTKKALARDKEGCQTYSSYAPDAVCWCLDGAIFKVYHNHKIRCEIVDKIELFINTSIPAWNDAPERTHQDVIDLCKKLDI